MIAYWFLMPLGIILLLLVAILPDALSTATSMMLGQWAKRLRDNGRPKLAILVEVGIPLLMVGAILISIYFIYTKSVSS